jgi:AraC-like DNA-binding protein
MHDEYGIGLVRRGAQKSRSGRGIVEAAAGDIITCNPGEVHDGVPIGGEARVWTMLYFDQHPIRQAADDIQEGGAGTFEFELPRLRNSRIAARFQRLFTSLTDDAEAEVCCGEESLIGLLADLMRPKTAPLPRVPPQIRRARERIDDAPDLPLTLSELASEAGLSRFQLLRGFRKVTGLTPHAYLVQRRLHLARRLIGKGRPLAEAAAASGFSDQSHMTRLFIRIYGLTPGRYSRAIG